MAGPGPTAKQSNPGTEDVLAGVRQPQPGQLDHLLGDRSAARQRVVRRPDSPTARGHPTAGPDRGPRWPVREPAVVPCLQAGMVASMQGGGPWWQRAAMARAMGAPAPAAPAFSPLANVPGGLHRAPPNSPWRQPPSHQTSPRFGRTAGCNRPTRRRTRTEPEDADCICSPDSRRRSPGERWPPRWYADTVSGTRARLPTSASPSPADSRRFL